MVKVPNPQNTNVSQWQVNGLFYEYVGLCDWLDDLPLLIWHWADQQKHLIVQVSDEILKGQHHGEFPLHV
jgi:hypothetical protein